MSLIYRNSFFSYYQECNWKGRCVIDLNRLFPFQHDRSLFESRWEAFFNSDPANTHILFRSADALEYLTAFVIPSFCATKPCLLLLFGNPAPHSVKAGVMFLSEGEGREHRIWRFLAETGVLSFGKNTSGDDTSKRWRMDRLLTANYESPFQLGMASFISFPSTTIDARWSGVAGVKRLFGAKAFTLLCNAEFERLQLQLKWFMPRKGIIVAFQRDVFNVLRSTDTPSYSRQPCFSGTVFGSLRDNSNVFLGAAPPTRWMHSAQARAAFIKIIGLGVTSMFRD